MASNILSYVVCCFIQNLKCISTEILFQSCEVLYNYFPTMTYIDTSNHMVTHLLRSNTKSDITYM